jgi:large subunit ribosomal protein L23
MHSYEVLLRPLITEKTVIAVDETNTYAFEVDMAANKFQVKDAVELAFDVTVERVRMMVMPAKTARRGRRLAVRKPKWKKAVVTLSPGNSIQLFEGV